MKQALINLRGIKAGILTEDEDGYSFQYDTEFLQSDVAEAVSLTEPLGLTTLLVTPVPLAVIFSEVGVVSAPAANADGTIEQTIAITRSRDSNLRLMFFISFSFPSFLCANGLSGAGACTALRLYRYRG